MDLKEHITVYSVYTVYSKDFKSCVSLWVLPPSSKNINLVSGNMKTKQRLSLQQRAVSLCRDRNVLILYLLLYRALPDSWTESYL